VGSKLTPKNFADVKKWIGIPDAVARRLPPQATTHPVSSVISPDIHRARKAITLEMKPSILAISQNYLFRDSTLYKSHKDLLAELIEGTVICRYASTKKVAVPLFGLRDHGVMLRVMAASIFFASSTIVERRVNSWFTFWSKFSNIYAASWRVYLSASIVLTKHCRTSPKT
jgi:hypothetical protein